MEKGWLIGVFVGLAVVFAIFLVGYYSGNQITGEFFHTKKTTTSIIDAQLNTTLEKMSAPQLKSIIDRANFFIASRSGEKVAIDGILVNPSKAERLASQVYTSKLEKSPPSIGTLIIPRNQYTRLPDGRISVKNAYVAVLNDNLEEVWEGLTGGKLGGPAPIDPMGSVSSGGCNCVQSCVCPPSPNCSCDPPGCGSCSPCPSCPD